MTLEERIADLEKKKLSSDKGFSKIIEVWSKTHTAINDLKKSVDKLGEKKIVTVENLAGILKEIKVINQVDEVTISNPVKEVLIKNPVDTVTVKNQVDSVTVKNPVEEVTVKNIPSLDPMHSVMKGIATIINDIPSRISKAIKQIVQPVNVTNQVEVILVDPNNKKPYKASTGSFAPTVASGGTSRSNKATSSSVTVGSSSTSVVEENKGRLEVLLVNDSDETIYLGYGSAAVLNKGLRINANGGWIVEDKYVGQIYAICQSGGKNLTIIDVPV